MFCPQCGKSCPDDSRFCEHCGSLIEAAPASGGPRGDHLSAAVSEIEANVRRTQAVPSPAPVFVPAAPPVQVQKKSHAGLVIALVMVFLLSRGVVVGSMALIAAAFAGSMISMGFILLLSRRPPQAGMLVVGGVMIGYICSAITDFVVTFADDANIVNLHNWSLGSFSGVSWDNVALMALVVGAALLLTFLLSKPIGAYQMGEVYARNMGVNIRRFRVELILLSSVLSACVTAFAGPISFVGIAAPHLIKALFRTAKPLVVIPACFLGGAAFCLGCDLIARTAFAPRDMSISSVTAVFGAPVVLYLMASRRSGRGGRDQ